MPKRREPIAVRPGLELRWGDPNRIVRGAMFPREWFQTIEKDESQPCAREKVTPGSEPGSVCLKS